MNLEKAVCQFLHEKGAGVPGKTLFYGHMPHQIKSGVVVLVRVPPNDDPYTRIRKGTFQVVVRDEIRDAAYDKAVSIKKLLRLEGGVVGGMSFKFILPKHDPLVYPRSDGGLFEASVNYQFTADNWE